MLRVLLPVTFASLVTAQTFPYDHIHLNAPDPRAASVWYETNFGARRLDEGPDRMMLGSTRLLFAKKGDAQPSSGSSVDHIGFSVADVDAKVKSLEAAGVKIVTPPRDIPGLFKIAFVEDPWGTRIEIVQDPELLGLHHIHLRGPDPDAMFAWMLDKFGGQRTKLKGRLDAVKYSAPGFHDLWILVQKGESQPSAGHAIDHIGFRSVGSLTKTFDELRSKGATIASEPRALPMKNGPGVNFGFVTGPAAVRIEIVERPGLKPGE